MRKLLAVLALLPGLLSAQQARQMARSTSAVALGDSSLVIVSDTLTSKTTFVTKAASLDQFRKTLSKFAFDSLKSTNVFRALATSAFTGVATFTAQPIMSSLTASLPVFSDGSKGLVSNAMTGTGNVVMSASPTLTGTLSAASISASLDLTLSGDSRGLINSGGARYLSYTAATGLHLGTTSGANKTSFVDATIDFGGGNMTNLGGALGISSASAMTGLASSSSTGTQVFSNSDNTAVPARFSGYAGITGSSETANEGSITLGGSNTGRQTVLRNDYDTPTTLNSYFDNTVDASAGGKIFFRFRTTGTPINSLILTDGTATFIGRGTFADTLTASSKMKAVLTAEGSTKNAVCIDGTTHELLENAAATCTVSAFRFKTNIKPLTLAEAERIVFGLKPVSFNYKSGGAAATGVIAEQADSIDHRLATRDAKGQITSVNYEQVTIALLKEVQLLRAQVDSLRRKP